MRKLMLAFVFFGVTLTALSVLPAASRVGPPTLEVVRRFAVPQKAGRVLVDARWAGKNSIYLADLRDGVTEVRLAEGLPQIRRVTPPAAMMGLPLIENVAISEKWIVVAHEGKIAWKAIGGGDWQVTKGIGVCHGLDICGDDLVMLGFPDGEAYERSRGGMVWRADLSKGLEGNNGWKALHESEDVAQDMNRLRQDAALGSIRILPQGGVLVAPNFLPGVLSFSDSGSFRQRWSDEDLWGGEVRAKGEGPEEKGWQEGNFGEEELRRFLASRRTIDAILPLPEGPAIVVRESKDDEARYRLGVLGPKVRWYDIPVGNLSAMARLRGDTDKNGRIVLVGVERGRTAPVSQSEILVLELPTSS
jgi:hypothetical protein